VVDILIIFTVIILIIVIYESREMCKTKQKKEIIVFSFFTCVSFALEYLVTKLQFNDSLIMMIFNILGIRY
jgi:hypothetical protein